MAKISNILLEFADVIKQEGLVSKDELSPSNKLVKRFIRLARQVPDARMRGMVEYPLKEILLIAFFAVLSGVDTWAHMAIFGKLRESWLRKFLKYKNGVPSHDTFRRVFSLIAPDVLQRLTVGFLMDNMNRIKASLGIEASGVRLINIDGKQANGTGRARGKDGAFPNLQALNVYDASSGICLAMKHIDRKTNEIPAAQEALMALDIKGAIVTCDALNTQKKTIEIIACKEKKGQYVAALKDNNHTFYSEVNEYFSEEKLKEIMRRGVNFVTSTEKAHSKVETRNFYLTSDVKWFEDRSEWTNLRAFICYEKIMTDTGSGEATRERRLFISSVKDAGLCAEAIRGHWAVENNLHWHLDFSFGDDSDMTTDKNAYQNFSLFRRMVLTICRMAQPFMKESIRTIRWSIGLEPQSQLGIILGTLDETRIESALRAAVVKKS
ncbi:MAG: ISAs1 family transposase [Synergistaceae bacterium]|nr:ISAs1 family transposase [Synergistaceae bacterium]